MRPPAPDPVPAPQRPRTIKLAVDITIIITLLYLFVKVWNDGDRTLGNYIVSKSTPMALSAAKDAADRAARDTMDRHLERYVHRRRR